MSISITPLTDPDYRPFSRRIAWLASDGDGNPIGSAFLRLNSKASSAHLAELELAVHPAERRHGIGSELLAVAAAAGKEHEARTMLADATAGSPADHFLANRGFTVGLTLIFARLALTEVSLPTTEPPGYRLESWSGVVSDELVETYAEARKAMDDAPVGDIEYGAEIWDVNRVRHIAKVVERRGESLLTVAAIEQSTGQIVGFTELVVPADGKGDAQHYGTAVLPKHRGHGLALWMKAESIRSTRSGFPDLTGLLTDTADNNTAMQRVNAVLGYRETHRTHRYTLDLGGS
ncbi:GNAT family N-acetyltransferase [Kribbella qitaiheensis]|uniref:GNAT family N-acetyltransferase n=1 Tax=Kribbella qitaiheensis TaxID=1544730 RepID=A0A7G6WT92_9ACTN|nr:GNAT family N-acetyltransferase [Kribbella qitaiheensis]QNE17207.1 GNAT family N-acetyltransferase [Kribbella qitaiheensis]